jgi:hypothetical protein
MGDYAEALRGSLKITSTPGIGTELSAKFPFRIDDSNLDDNGPHSATTGNVLADPKARGAVRFAEENSVD